MTSTVTGRSPVVIELDETVIFNSPDDEVTRRLVAPPRRPKLDETVEQPAVAPATIGVVEDPASMRRVITPEEIQTALDKLAAAKPPTAYVPVVAKRPTLWQRLTYTGQRRAQGRIARWLNGGAL